MGGYKMSDIGGVGYGDKHDWKRGETAQVGDRYWDKGTGYHCPKCGASFNHAYDIIPNIFQAIEQAGVKENCKELKDK